MLYSKDRALVLEDLRALADEWAQGIHDDAARMFARQDLNAPIFGAPAAALYAVSDEGHAEARARRVVRRWGAKHGRDPEGEK